MTATDKRTRCGLCGDRTRYIGSHVLREHIPYGESTPALATATLAAERAARVSK